ITSNFDWDSCGMDRWDGARELFRLRTGTWRATFEVYKISQVILITCIRQRKEAYRSLIGSLISAAPGLPLSGICEDKSKRSSRASYTLFSPSGFP
ncbi:MAG: hypothetical protein RDV48_30575, partial [Candidatus Eremiobacteraeota bacterium]|nr:hypothetical protein [Candidatus Eremiobacteraeota bacterium]